MAKSENDMIKRYIKNDPMFGELKELLDKSGKTLDTIIDELTKYGYIDKEKKDGKEKTTKQKLSAKERCHNIHVHGIYRNMYNYYCNMDRISTLLRWLKYEIYTDRVNKL